MTVLPDRSLSDEAWARVLAARARGETAHREIAAYVALHGLRITPTRGDDALAFVVARENGYVDAAALDPYTGAWVVPTVVGGAQIITGGLTDHQFEGVAERYSYPGLMAARWAFATWQMERWQGEPRGWVRHQPSDRRRSYDDMGEMIDEEIRA